mmetsp:Transcript_17936/g.47932  ORF Transcript_17936/g.47932 Transcript_17936/m.47932 type:complete len:246 (+) Transcript_17936:389-1126(+)
MPATGCIVSRLMQLMPFAAPTHNPPRWTRNDDTSPAGICTTAAHGKPREAASYLQARSVASREAERSAPSCTARQVTWPWCPCIVDWIRGCSQYALIWPSASPQNSHLDSSWKTMAVVATACTTSLSFASSTEPSAAASPRQTSSRASLPPVQRVLFINIAASMPSSWPSSSGMDQTFTSSEPLPRYGPVSARGSAGAAPAAGPLPAVMAVFPLPSGVHVRFVKPLPLPWPPLARLPLSAGTPLL